jgi:NitT/TauT family transport system ATP-binding protein
MDEPFGSLDSETRNAMHLLLLELWATSRQTIVFVTHQLDEAILLSDRVCVFTPRPGQIRGIVDIPLPRPRSELSPDLLHFKRQLVQLMSGAPSV